MITAERKRRLQKKIQASRERLMSTHPLFAILLMYLRFVSVRKMKRISTNGRCIYFSPDFLDKLYERELDLILCHEILHLVLGHIWRPPSKEGIAYHFACDVQVNALLFAYGFPHEHCTHLGYLCRTIPGRDTGPGDMTPSEILALLPYDFTEFCERADTSVVADSDCFWDRREDAGEAGDVILEPPGPESLLTIAERRASATPDDGEGEDEGKEGGEGEGDEADAAVWRERAATAARAAASGEGDKGCGNMPSAMRRVLEGTHRPTVDWRRVLNDFIQERTSDYSFSPPDRRFADTDFFLPDLNEKEFVTKEILFMADTSGSVGSRELATVYSELHGAIEQFGGKLTGRLGFFDTALTPPEPFADVGDLANIIPYGGGGTDFRIIFDYIRSELRDDPPASVVIFTDGRGPYPTEAETMHIPVLWILNNEHVTPPFGKTVRTCL